jgi:hypothetical protein
MYGWSTLSLELIAVKTWWLELGDAVTDMHLLRQPVDFRLGRRDGNPTVTMTTSLCDKLSCLLWFGSWRQYLTYRRLSPRTPQEPRHPAIGRPGRLLVEPIGFCLQGGPGPQVTGCRDSAF